MMPEEPEVPMEHLHETLEHHAHGAEDHSGGRPDARWAPIAALSAAFLAVLAAIASLLAGHHANEAMIDEIRASDGYAYYQAKGIKASVLQSKIEVLAALGKDVDPSDRSTVERYGKEQQEIKKEADENASSSSAHLVTHGVLARSVTLFQVAIAMAAISILTKRRPPWYLSLLLGLAGLAFLAQALL